MIKAIFEGMVFDTLGRQLQVAYVGDEPTYVIDDSDFERHVPAGELDRQVWNRMSEGIEGNEDFLSEQTAKLLGQDDIFSIAVIRNQFENRDKQFSELQEKGLPYDLRMYMTMVGFQVVVNHRGEVMEVKQPAVTNGDEE
ncbi:MAG: hypothetical protein RBS09_07215 [Anaerolineaceae bacterium]|nr:hypothetical protein [Anaerolineaceae bacterium]